MLRMRFRTWTLAACGLAALAGCSSGGSRIADRNEPVRAIMSADVMMFVSFDTDGDLSISAAEIDAGLNREFARADTTGDGSLQPIEFQSWANAVLGGGQMGPFRLDFDRNVDNVITRQEFDTEIRARVREYDSDENSAVSRQEFIRLVGQARPPAPVRRPVVLPPNQ
jgi:hypothetical protein